MEKKIASGIMLTLLLTSMLTLAFNIQAVKAVGTIYIRADGSIDPPTAPITTVDNVTYTLTGNITSDADGIVIERDNIIIDGNGYTLQGSGSGNGFYLSSTSNVTIQNTSIRGFDHGIEIAYSSSNSISGNKIANNGHGISLLYSSNNAISGNNIANNSYNGIFLTDSSNNSISGNNITNNNGDGIYLSGSYCSMSGNNVTSNSGYGIYLVQSSNCSISGNRITNNSQDGISLSGSNNTVSGNNITGNSQRGISLFSSDNTVSGNNIDDNSQYGIYLSGSNNNSISENNIKNSGDGVYLTWCSNNRFWHNNFVNNTHQASSDTYSSDNSWDDGYTSGGNYWSDYKGVDVNSGPNQDLSGSDGVGDTPYIIDDNNRDRYPLVNPWTPPEHDLAVSITAAVHLQLDSSTSLNATVTNKGLDDEVNVEFRLLINGTITNSTIIPLLQTGNSYTLSCVWMPTAKGKYNVTAYARPVPGETFIGNNQETKSVTVSPPPEVGVKTGDWIKIDYTLNGWPAGTPYPEWLKVEFLSVEGTNATVRVTMHMSDGTEQNATMPVDVVAGGGTFQGLSGFVIPANCTIGDSIYMSGYGNVTIAGETTRSYAGASRTVVHASFSQYGTQLTYYWDKQTGIMVEATTVSGSMTASGKATETNMWEVVSSPLWMQWWFYAIVAVIIIALAGAVYFLRKRKPPTQTTPPLPTEST